MIIHIHQSVVYVWIQIIIVFRFVIVQKLSIVINVSKNMLKQVS
jgi:hypothetical protein